MAIQKFEDIFACQKAQNLAVDVYSTFRDLKDYGFRDQICRAAVSISNNAPATFDVGTTEVIWETEDQSGNLTTCIKMSPYLMKRLLLPFATIKL